MYQDPQRGVVEVACWAHARRKFYEAQSSRSTILLAYLRLLYNLEREARDRKLDPEEHRVLRQAKSKPNLDDLSAYLERAAPGASEESAKASHRLHLVELASPSSLL